MVTVVRGRGSFMRCCRCKIARSLIVRFFFFFILVIIVAIEILSKFSSALAFAEKVGFEKETTYIVSRVHITILIKPLR